MAGVRQNTEFESYSCDEDEDLFTGFEEETFSDVDITRLSTLPELLVSDEMNQTETLNEERESLACTETGSQIARSIISNIFRQIDGKNDIGESLNPSDEKTEEIEMLSNHVMGRVEEKDKMSSIQSTSTDPDSVFQSPKTVERISNWINDLQSNVSLDGYTSYSSPVTIKSRSSATKKSFNIMSVGSKDEDVYSDQDEEDDQPSGYTTLLTPRSRFEVSCFESPKIRLEAHRLNSSINSFSSWLSRKDEEEEKMELRHRKQTQDLANLQYINPEKQDDGGPRNHYLKIVETTSQKIRREEDGSQTMDTVHTLEKSEKYQDPSSLNLSYSVLIPFVLALCILVLYLAGLFPVPPDCFSRIKEIRNQTNGKVLENII